MGSRLSHGIRHLITFLLCFLITWSYFKPIAEGRTEPNLQKQSIGIEQNQTKGEEKVGVMVRLLIGSRPPRCERRCKSCGHCEAVQVPINPVLNKSQQQQQSRRTRTSRSGHLFVATPTIAYSRGDDISNYKPMCWKCKCGNFMFNP